MQDQNTKERIAAQKHAHYLLTHPGAKTLAQIHEEKLAKALRTGKACKACGVVKPMADFSSLVNTADGRAYVCRECDRLKRRSKDTIPTVCAGCGINFLANEHDMKRRGVLYHNRACSDKYHYRRGGTVGARGSTEERFWRKVDKSPGQGPKGECWNWIGAKNPYGQGVFREVPGKGSLTMAHELAWRLSHGPIPTSLRVLQRCRNNACVCCLFVGKKADKNIPEREAKRRRTEKPCKHCGIVKLMGQFGPSKATADGKSYRCRECVQKVACAKYKESPVRLREYRSKWAREHREAGKHIAHRRRTRKKNLPGSHTLEEWKALCKKFQNRCVRCGAKSKLTRDHVIPISDPRSSNDIANLQPLCHSCNSSKGNHHATDYRKSPFINKGQTVMF